MQSRRFVQCDVFTSVPLKGNGLAVVLDGEGIAEQDMQAFTDWTNLAEVTFVLPPRLEEADYRVRIFSAGGEMRFAGHPTLGTCAAWLHTGGTPREAGMVRQDCGVGVVEIDISGPVPAFAAPDTTHEVLSEARLEAIVTALRLPPERLIRTGLLRNGSTWQVIELASAQDVLNVEPFAQRLPEFRGVSLIGAYPPGSECDYEVRNLGPSSAMSEDPITGSLNAAIGVWMYGAGHWSGDVTVAQGTCIGRQGRVHLRRDRGRVWVGGESHVVIEGVVRL